MKEYIAVLFTHSDAIKLSRECKKRNIVHKLMPVPRKLSSNCGVCVNFHCEEDIQSLIFTGIEKIFHVEDGNYILVYE
jgi:putative Se/S carrier protein